MELYKTSRIVIAKRNYNGSCKFIKWNEFTKRYYIGESASTSISTSAAVEVYGVTQREIKDVARQLSNQGFTEYQPDWSRNYKNGQTRVYDDNKEAGL